MIVIPASPADEPVLRNLAQLYAYDFAAIMGWAIPDSGRFPDQIVDGCFDRPERHPFLLRAESGLVGFAIVDTRSRLSGEDGVNDVAEFFVARPARRQGIGVRAAHALFDRFAGRWEVRQTEANRAALAFWRQAIGRYTEYQETFHQSERWRGPVQSFTR